MWKCSVKLPVALVSSKILSFLFLVKLAKSSVSYHHNFYLQFMCLHVLVLVCCGKYCLLFTQQNKVFREVQKNWRKFPGSLSWHYHCYALYVRQIKSQLCPCSNHWQYFHQAS